MGSVHGRARVECNFVLQDIKICFSAHRFRVLGEEKGIVTSRLCSPLFKLACQKLCKSWGQVARQQPAQPVRLMCQHTLQGLHKEVRWMRLKALQQPSPSPQLAHS